MTVTASSLKSRYKEFANEPDADVEFAVEDAADYVDNKQLSAKDIDKCITNLAAHFLTVQIALRQTGTGQRIKSESFGPISVSYEAIQGVTPDATDFSTTPYGQRYLHLLELSLRGPLVI